MGLLDKVINRRAGIVLGVVLAVVGVVAACGGGDSDENSGDGEAIRSQRTSPLSFCVDTFMVSAADGDVASIRDEAKATVEEALVLAESNSLWEASKVDQQGERCIDKGCPSEPLLAKISADDWIDGYYNGPPGPEVTEDSYSPYGHQIFVIPRDELEMRLPQTDLRGVEQRHSTEESVCSGHVCRGVTWGIYVTPEELGDIEFMTKQIELSLGLRTDF